MYKVIGGDQQEYGPITDAEMRQWIAEGRLNVQSLARTETEETFRPLSTFPEFAGALGIVTGAPFASTDWSKRDYQLDIGACFSRGWDVFQKNLGVLLGCSVLFVLIVILASMALGGVLNLLLIEATSKEMAQSFGCTTLLGFAFKCIFALVAGPLIAGYYYVFIQMVRRQSPGVGEMFIGFQKNFSQLYLGNLVPSILVGLCMVPFNFAESSRLQPLINQMQNHPTPAQMQSFVPHFWQTLAGTFPVLLACLVPVMYLLVSLQFTLPLIIDKQIGFWTAMKLSWKMVHKHGFTVFGLFFVTLLLSFAGILLCCVGFLFALPFCTAAMMFCYETIFGELPAA